MRKTLLMTLLATATLLLGAGAANAQHPFPIDMKGYDASGNIVTITPDTNSTIPYSPKATCGTCHDYDTISLSYHVEQGRSVMSDDYGPPNDRPDFVLSPGMFGGW